MDRKDFIKTCGKICAGSVAAFYGLESCTGNYYAISKAAGNELVVAKSEFIEIKKNKNIHRKYVLIRTEKLNFPVCLFKLNEQTYSALLMECTHSSCELNPNGDYLVCPCHGSEFNNLGVVQNPPADTNLRIFKVTHDHENVYVHLS